MRTTRLIHRSVAALTLIAFAGLAAGAGIQGKKPKGADPALIAKGKKVYTAAGCTACHAIGGNGGKTGPDLSHAGKGKNEAWMTAKIRDPKKSKPDSTMPAYTEEQISAKDLKGLNAYMLSLK